MWQFKEQNFLTNIYFFFSKNDCSTSVKYLNCVYIYTGLSVAYSQKHLDALGDVKFRVQGFYVNSLPKIISGHLNFI